MDIVITSIQVVRVHSRLQEIALSTDLIPVVESTPDVTVFRIRDGLTTPIADELQRLPLPSMLTIRRARVYITPGGNDLLQLDIEMPSHDTNPGVVVKANLETPEGCGSNYLIKAAKVVPAVFQMSKGKAPKPTGRCPICFHRHNLTQDGLIRKHKEDIGAWKFARHYRRVLLERQDRRVELWHMDANGSDRAFCGGSYLPPLESSPAGLLWAIQRYDQAIAGHQNYQHSLATEPPDHLVYNELLPEKDGFGMEMCMLIANRGTARYEQCLVDETKKAHESIQRLSVKVLKLKQLLAWVNLTHAHGSSRFPLDRLKIDIEHLLFFECMSPKEASALVAGVMS